MGGKSLDLLHTTVWDVPAGMAASALGILKKVVGDVLGRKVRTPRGAVVGNAHRPASAGKGKCHRKQTARPEPSGAGKVRVKR